ncbi:hypothetical protein SAMN05216184_10794 [Georgenia satyanarayanai]|uniref:Uncharacterized protein n=1 Tax=Georgenia satyanarayanai TaxID=860221 RepID=A0A2Y9AGW0_9MICO|nr:DUF5719 family protein [Georgenia satyanarayanai]PYF99384.1 hypothetical protein A8987_10794 [Georgenia satyanarayanai]SSA43196.1 hypothetical protein SAMN05216184_10794 [Georgenia satyanarayanai]
MSAPTSRRVLRRVSTAVSGAVLLAAAAGVALEGKTLPVDAAAVRDVVVPVDAARVAQVCPGPPRLATAVDGEDLGYDEFDPEGSGTSTVLDVVTLARGEDEPPGALRLRPSLGAPAGEEVSLAGSARLAQLTDAGEATVLEADPVEDAVALAAGTSVAVTGSGDLRGLAATSCQTPSTSAWLVGGSTQPGDSAQLVLSNVGQTPASVTLAGWGSTGALDLSTAGTVLVPAGGQRIVLLEALAADPRVAIHVAAAGGEVTALVQDSRLRGLVPGGTDLVAPSVPPAETVVVPGIFLGETSGEEADAPAVRVVNPGEETATVSLELLGADGPEPVPGAEDLVLDPGAVVDVSLTGIPGGPWSAVVSADRPVTAAAVTTTVGTASEEDPGTAPVDRAWSPAVPALASGVVAVPGDAVTSRYLVLANPADGDVEVELVPVLRDGTRGAPVTRTLGARTTLREDVAALADGEVAALQVRAADGAVHGGVMLTAAAPDGSLMSFVPLSEDARTASAVPLAPAPRPLG